MANSEQALKRIRQNEKTRARQKGQATSVRTAMAKVKVAVEDNTDNKVELLQDATKAIDKAASKGLIHKNKASREKSRLTKLVNKN
jgi:small subunit ribosomal protein S20